jgi:hypothetical protein
MVNLFISASSPLPAVTAAELSAFVAVAESSTSIAAERLLRAPASPIPGERAGAAAAAAAAGGDRTR